LFWANGWTEPIVSDQWFNWTHCLGSPPSLDLEFLRPIGS
jgi:hypothetical protein